MVKLVELKVKPNSPVKKSLRVGRINQTNKIITILNRDIRPCVKCVTSPKDHLGEKVQKILI